MVLSGPPEPRAWQRMLEASALSEEALHAGYWAHRHDYDRGTLTGSEYWQAVAHHAATSFTAVQIETLLHADVDLWTDLNRPMVEWALALKRAGIRTGILSNIGDAIAAGICDKLPWLSEFDHCTWSYALKMAKPQPEIYLATANALGAERHHILFVDDREDNIAAAKALGFQVIQYTTHDAFERAMRDRGLAWLLDVADLPEPALATKPSFLSR